MNRTIICRELLIAVIATMILSMVINERSTFGQTTVTNTTMGSVVSQAGHTAAILVATDKPTYNNNEDITIFGSVIGYVSGTTVSLKITNPLGNLIWADQVQMGQDNTFSTKRTATGSLWSAEGTYTVYAQYGSNFASHATFTFSAAICPSAGYYDTNYTNSTTPYVVRTYCNHDDFSTHNDTSLGFMQSLYLVRLVQINDTLQGLPSTSYFAPTSPVILSQGIGKIYRDIANREYIHANNDASSFKGTVDQNIMNLQIKNDIFPMIDDVIYTTSLESISPSNSGSTNIIQPPGSPLNLQASVSGGQVSLSWHSPSSNGSSALTGYNIYRGTVSGQESMIDTVGSSINSYTNTGLTNGQTFYEVIAVNSVGESNPSNEVSVTVGWPDITFAAIIAIIVIAIVNGISFVTMRKSIGRV